MRIPMRSSIFYKILPLFCCTILLACGNDKPIQGFDPDVGFDDDDLGSVRKATLHSVDLQFSFEDTMTTTGSSPNLSIGTFSNIDTKTLIKFESFPNPDSLTILDAALILRTSVVTGNVAGQTFEATVHRVTADWEEASVRAETFGEAFDPTPLANATIHSIYRVDSLNVERVRFDLGEDGTELIRQWADSTSGVNNFGFLIDSNGADFIKQFYSTEFFTGSRAPQLEVTVRVQRTGADTTLTTTAMSDAYLVERGPGYMLPDGPLYVDHIFSRQSIIRFDLSQIPRESTINRAEFIFNIEQDNSVLNSDGFSVQLVQLDNAVTTPDLFEVGSNASALSSVPNVQESTTTVSVPIRSILQAWVNEVIENNGLLLRSATPGKDVSYIAVAPCESDTTRCPRLVVDYTVPPTLE